MSKQGTYQAPLKKSPYEGVLPARVEYTIGAETSNTITVGVQMQSGGYDLYAPGAIQIYLSSAADGLTVSPAPSGGWAAPSNGVLLPIIANTYGTLVSNTSGGADVVITETGAVTFYVVSILPTGEIVVSDAVTFA